MINWPILLSIRDKVDTNHFSPDLPHTLPRTEVQPAKFSGAFLYLITYLELAVHIPPLGWTRSGQASHAIQKRYFGVWQPWAGFCSAGPISLLSPSLYFYCPCGCHIPPTSVYHVLEWLTVVDIIYVTRKMPSSHHCQILCPYSPVGPGWGYWRR